MAMVNAKLKGGRGATHFGHVVVMKKLGLTVVPLDLHARPIGSDDRALIRCAVMPSHAVAYFQSFGLVGRHDGILPRESRLVPPRRTLFVIERDVAGTRPKEKGIFFERFKPINVTLRQNHIPTGERRAAF
jgi:hypothetical protein